MQHRTFGKTGLQIPPIVFGATSLGNLFKALSDEEKHQIVEQWLKLVPAPIVIDSAGKYGAGLSLEVIGRELTKAGVAANDVIISNKLAWRRVPLKGPEPTFEPDAWIGLEHDAVQDISYDGILRCWEEGCALLGGRKPALISVHDPDEYLAAAVDADDRKRRLDDLIGAYRALVELRDAGEAVGVGVGAKHWRSIEELDRYCDFDWVMFANSFTIMHHPIELRQFMDKLAARQIGVLNSALFHGGFLVGGEFFDYRKLRLDDPSDQNRVAWRTRFWDICHKHQASPFEAAVAFGRTHSAIHAIALSSSRADRIASHIEAVEIQMPAELWQDLYATGMIEYIP